MSVIKRLMRPLLKPGARFADVPGVATTAGTAAGDWGEDAEAPAYGRSRLRAADLFRNVPLMFGGLILLALFVLVVFGPAIAPQNPYLAGQHIVPHYDADKGEFIRPPLEPSAEYPLGTDRWGTDILSMLLHGARNTLIAATFVTMLRIIIGLTLGAIAGWNEGRTADRLIMGIIGTLNALPLLISTIILVYALDIRRGLPVFIVALAALGWSEIAQYIRSEFMVLRKMPYIEGADATGLTGVQTAVRHVLPNVLPQLLIITFLEMGAVLLLLGEMAFVGVFIGGGSRIDLSEPLGPQRIFTIAEVPEWGSMLAEGHRWLRSKPFVVMSPAVAFFVAIMGFNLFGEGLRRLVEKQSINTAFLLRKRMLIVIGAVTLATIFIMNNTGAAPWFARVAQAFSGEQVYAEIVTLSELDGRGLGQPGGATAADYLAAKFAEYGLEPGWKDSTYVYPLETTLVRPTAQPVLQVLDARGAPQGAFRHQVDFGYLIEGHGGSGSVRAPVTYVGFDPTRGEFSPAQFAGLDLRGRVVLLEQGRAPANFADEALIRGAAGVVWMAGNGRDAVRSQIQFADPNGQYLQTPQMPVMRVRPAVVDALLAVDSLTRAALDDLAGADQRGDGWHTRDLSAEMALSIALDEPQTAVVPNLLGYLPGSDLDIADELVVVFTTYDGLGVDPDGTVYPAANHNASGVGLMLEVIRLWQEQQLDTRRTTLFVAWGGGTLDANGARDWIGDNFNFRHMRTSNVNSRVVPTVLIQLDYLGAGDDLLLIHPDSSGDLAALVEEKSSEVGVPTQRATDTAEFTSDILTRQVRDWVALKLANSSAPPDADTLDRIDAGRLQKLGEMLTLVLTNIARETSY